MVAASYRIDITSQYWRREAPKRQIVDRLFVAPVLVLVHPLLVPQVLVLLRQALPLPLAAEEFPGCSPSMIYLQTM